ncbi:M24 family metallopeptidase [Herbiconiux sp. SYSU D00978]|uniref:M24 family metallopeptidase n=1 Tax=Herbiconiux sp. SYSU D00978 TaxID=2812562 RepID=UPI001F6156A5|nr:M24 family metallopeptidase [Herbiconiux sp. SYSU D00978]
MLAWFLDGARVSVSLNGAPVLAVAVSPEEETVYCYENEADRMLAEELPDGLDVQRVPWHVPLSDAAGRSGDLAEADVVQELRGARASLLPLELARYRTLCREVAALVTDVLLEASPAQTERALASVLAGRVVAAGADPLVVLVSGADRLGYRHPLPTSAPLGRRAMVVVCARRHGMIANITRWVTFERPSQNELTAERAILNVEAAAFDATRPGLRLDVPFDALRAAYPRFGFAEDEWERHHQGGPAGYFGRDPRATPAARELIVERQAFAWNPSAPGTKVEDTVLVTGDDVEVLTVDPRWPTVQHRGRARPVALDRSAG